MSKPKMKAADAAGKVPETDKERLARIQEWMADPRAKDIGYGNVAEYFLGKLFCQLAEGTNAERTDAAAQMFSTLTKGNDMVEQLIVAVEVCRRDERITDHGITDYEGIRVALSKAAQNHDSLPLNMPVQADKWTKKSKASQMLLDLPFGDDRIRWNPRSKRTKLTLWITNTVERLQQCRREPTEAEQTRNLTPELSQTLDLALSLPPLNKDSTMAWAHIIVKWWIGLSYIDDHCCKNLGILDPRSRFNEIGRSHQLYKKAMERTFERMLSHVKDFNQGECDPAITKSWIIAETRKYAWESKPDNPLYVVRGLEKEVSRKLKSLIKS